ncbi:MAG: iron chaperone [Candidatus Limnocylindrales bacterium]
MADTKTSSKRGSSGKTSGNVFSEEERAAMQESIRERTKAAKLSPEESRAAGEQDVLAKIASLDEPDRAMAERFHAVVKATAPELSSRTWYGSPAYYRDGNLICYFQERAKFKSRYATLGFCDKAHLGDGAIWPVVYALMELTPAVEARIAALVKEALG